MILIVLGAKVVKEAIYSLGFPATSFYWQAPIAEEHLLHTALSISKPK